ncbi:uncharacterized protein J4E92_008330 [Alternaria infectoria]|uniref:uncharacterized protein n=1 Tax=Alternaria infectoria TaxID=45303 RepID=UPI00221FF262|nr:uncharacterized protein J4E92_008330 [Alternaria infectoria]KAI4920687.1 hypothetical protein J4E92_008330 [Alternaria infectoria]
MSSAKGQARVQEEVAEDAGLCQKLDDLKRVLGARNFHTEKVVEYNAQQFASLTEEFNTRQLMDMNGKLHTVILTSRETQDVCFFTPLDVASSSYARSRTPVLSPLSYGLLNDLSQQATDDSQNVYVPIQPNPLKKREVSSTQELASRSAARPDHAEIPSPLTSFPYFLENKINMYIWPRLIRDRSDRRIDSLLQVDTKVNIAWKESLVRNNFLGTFDEKWPAEFPAANINKVVCFGLGELYGSEGEEDPDSLRRDDPCLEKYLILLAFELVHWLEHKLHVHVPMILEDSRCDQQDRQRIEDFAKETVTPISFMDKCQALLEVDKNTLVLAPGKPHFAIRSPIADLAKIKGAPAGIFCETVPMITTTKQEVEFGKDNKTDPPTMGVASMVKDHMEDVCRIPRWGLTFYLKRALLET